MEWPVPLLGRIDDAFMDLPPEVMRSTMRANQKYFSLRRADGGAAPRFAPVANIDAADGGAAVWQLCGAREWVDPETVCPRQGAVGRGNGLVARAGVRKGVCSASLRDGQRRLLIP